MGHRLELDSRERLVVTGVEEVERFDEEEIVMRTTAGTLVVGGTELHIGKLNLDGGELHVDGSIHTLLYEDNAPASGQGGLLRRLFGSWPWATRSRSSWPCFSAQLPWGVCWAWCTTWPDASGGWGDRCGGAGWTWR